MHYIIKALHNITLNNNKMNYIIYIKYEELYNKYNSDKIVRIYNILKRIIR